MTPEALAEIRKAATDTVSMSSGRRMSPQDASRLALALLDEIDRINLIGEEVRTSTRALLTAVTFAGVADLGGPDGKENPGYLARVPDTFVDLARAALAKSEGKQP